MKAMQKKSDLSKAEAGFYPQIVSYEHIQMIPLQNHAD
jgi:hypothetical protein